MNKQALLDTVEQSPKAVAIHDKKAWMAIFAKYHAVEDPIGSTPHFGGLYDSVSGERGNGALDRFYDTFIAPNNIQFEVAQDIVCGQHVVRDLTVHIQMSDSLQASVPMHLLYELTKEDGEQGETWKIQRLAAHWELMPMMAQIFGKGLSCVSVLFSLTIRMLKFQKLSGIWGFCKAAKTIGNNGKESVDKFIAAINNQNRKELEGLFCDVSLGDAFVLCENKMPIAQWLSQDVKILKFSKVLVAGSFVTVSLSLSVNNEIQLGVAFFEFNSKSKKIRTLKLYLS